MRQFFLLLGIIFIGFIGISLPYALFGPMFLQPENFSFLPVDYSENERIFWLGITLAVYPLGMFVGSPLLGGLSDAYGRKKVLVMSLFLTAVGCFVTGVSLSVNSLSLLILSRFVTGISEGNIAIARAMVQDLSKNGGPSLHSGLGKINAAASIAYIVGPLIGGLFSTTFVSLPFYLSAVMTFGVLVLSMKLLEETRQVQARKFTFKELNFFGPIVRLYRMDALRSILVCSTLFTLAVDAFYQFFPVYLASLSFLPVVIAGLNGSLSLALAIGNGVLPQVLAKYFSNRRLIIGGSILFAVWLFLFCFQDTVHWLAVLLVCCGLSLSMATVNYSVELSNRADNEIQGQAFGVLMGMRTFGDASICLIGTACMLSAAHMPLLVASFVALFSVGYFRQRGQEGIQERGQA